MIFFDIEEKSNPNDPEDDISIFAPDNEISEDDAKKYADAIHDAEMGRM